MQHLQIVIEIIPALHPITSPIRRHITLPIQNSWTLAMTLPAPSHNAHSPGAQLQIRVVGRSISEVIRQMLHLVSTPVTLPVVMHSMVGVFIA